MHCQTAVLSGLQSLQNVPKPITVLETGLIPAPFACLPLHNQELLQCCLLTLMGGVDSQDQGRLRGKVYVVTLEHCRQKRLKRVSVGEIHLIQTGHNVSQGRLVLAKLFTSDSSVKSSCRPGGFTVQSSSCGAEHRIPCQTCFEQILKCPPFIEGQGTFGALWLASYGIKPCFLMQQPNCQYGTLLKEIAHFLIQGG